MNIAIIGGGISGLATAFYLKKYSSANEITIFESEPSFGGKLKTLNKYGFAIEIGANGFLSNKSDVFDLAKDAGLEHLIIESSDAARKRYIYDKALHILPESPSAFLKTELLSTLQKLRVAMEFFVPSKKNNDDETLQQFGYRRVGKGMTNVFLDAMTAGVFASTPEKLSVNAAFPAVVKLEKEYGGLLRGMLAKKKKEAGPGGILMSFRGGVSTFVEALSKSFDFTAKLNTEVTKVKQVGKKWLVECENGTTGEFDKVVLSTPSYVAARLLKEEDDELSELLKTIEYSPVAVVALGYDNLPHPLDGFGLLTTKRSATQVLGILWDSSIFPDRAEKGKKLIRVMIGGQRQPLLALKEEDELLNIATGGISETMGVYEEPLLKHVVRWHKAIPNYAIGHIALIDSIMNKEKSMKGLYLNSNAYKGISFNDCVKNSKESAIKIISE